MKKLFRKTLTCLVVSVLVFSTSACSGKSGISLARSKEQKDLSECLTLLQKKKHDKAIQCLESFKSRHYGQASASLADLAMADAHFDKKDYIVAAEAYQIFIEANPFSDRLPYAYYKGGLSYLKAAPKAIDRDQTYLEDAVRMLETVGRYYKASSEAQDAQTAYHEARLRLAKRQFYIGRFYYRYREYLAAAPRFQTLVTEFAGLGLDEKSFYYLIKSLQKTNQKELAVKYLDVFKESFPNSKYVKQLN